MYLIINDKQYSVSKRIVTNDTIKYLTVTPEPDNISGIARMYTDEGFLLSEDNLDDFERKTYTGTLLVATNKPEYVPQPPPSLPEYVTYEVLAQAIREGVNSVE